MVNSENNDPEITSTLLIYQVKKELYHNAANEKNVLCVHLSPKVGEADSGKYSCRPSNTDLASTTVYVIKGKIYLLLRLVTNQLSSYISDEHQQNLKSINNLSPYYKINLILFSMSVLEILIQRSQSFER